MLPEFASPLIGISIFAIAMVVIYLYFGFCRNRKGGHKPGESVRPNHPSDNLYTVCGGAYYTYCITDLNPSCISSNVIVSIAPQRHHRVLFSQKNPVNHTARESTEKNQTHSCELKTIPEALEQRTYVFLAAVLELRSSNIHIRNKTPLNSKMRTQRGFTEKLRRHRPS